MQQIGEQDKRRQPGRQVPLAVAVVVLEVIPLVFKVLLFSFSIFHRMRRRSRAKRTLSVHTVI
jgi:hypothetical protein